MIRKGLIDEKKETQFKKQLKQVLNKEFVSGLAKMSASYRQKQATIEHMNDFGRSQSQPVLREFGDDDFSVTESDEEIKLSSIVEDEDYEVEDVRASVD